jgi:cell surface protein SprA
VTFPLKSSLIQGSQSLFGFKTDLQFGHLKLSLLASQQKGQQKNITVQGGAQLQQFNVRADEYDENRNFFLTHYFRDHFEESLNTLPINNSKVSIRTATLEVWVTPPPNDIRSTSQNGNPPTYRDILALADLGEHDTLSKIGLPVNNLGENIDITGLSYLPSNDGNKLFQLLDTNQIVNRELDKILNYVTGPEFQLENTRDFVKQRMRKLEPTEYHLNETLGYISLNSPLKQNEALAVSFEYDYNGRTFRVGEFTKDFPQFNPAANTTNSTVSTRPKVLFTKLIKAPRRIF